MTEIYHPSPVLSFDVSAGHETKLEQQGLREILESVVTRLESRGVACTDVSPAGGNVLSFSCEDRSGISVCVLIAPDLRGDGSTGGAITCLQGKATEPAKPGWLGFLMRRPPEPHRIQPSDVTIEMVRSCVDEAIGADPALCGQRWMLDADGSGRVP